MILFPNCKINLGLNILKKRDDGFHDLETVFYPLMLKDVLEIIPTTNNQNQTPNTKQVLLEITNSKFEIPSFSSSGLTIEGDSSSNLCVKAYQLLKNDFPNLPSIKIHLHKSIPIGAGLGGGSADGAFTLKLLNEKFKLKLSTEQLINYALQLGSDCPFFIINQPCFATARGEVLNPIKLDLSAYKFVIVNPGIHVNTGWAFSTITPSIPKKSIRQIIQQSITTWKNELVNDFEISISKVHVEIASIKQQLYTAGATYASMSGSGSTVFGIFEKEINPNLSFPASYYTAIV